MGTSNIIKEIYSKVREQWEINAAPPNMMNTRQMVLRKIIKIR